MAIKMKGNSMIVEKIDVAIQSYKKPESLIYTLLTLKKYCGQHIDTIYIQDDCSGLETIKKYQDPAFLEAMNPINIKLHINSNNCGIHYFSADSLNKFHNRIMYVLYRLRGVNPNIVKREDMRYQYALDNTDKEYVLLIHDDVQFTGDIVAKYLNSITNNTAIIGDLGQCWRCPLSNRCCPAEIANHKLPSNSRWPITYCADTLKDIHRFKYEKRSCRINEWCCLLNVKIAKELAEDSIYFGAYEDLGDIGAYWFDEIVHRGYDFDDPLAPNSPLTGQTELRSEKSMYYIHCWQGFTGHSVWQDQGDGKNTYPIDMINERLKDEYGLTLGKH